MTPREERKQLKQKLFTIRRYMAGEPVRLTSELIGLKAQYESAPGFTRWADFPEKWDIGDPHSVKAGAFAFDATTANNFQKAYGQPYSTIVRLDTPESPSKTLDELFNMLCADFSGLRRIHPPDDALGNLRAGHIALTVEDDVIEIHYLSRTACTVVVYGTLNGVIDAETVNKLPSADILTALNNPTATKLRDALVALSVIQPSAEEHDQCH